MIFIVDDLVESTQNFSSSSERMTEIVSERVFIRQVSISWWAESIVFLISTKNVTDSLPAISLSVQSFRKRHLS